MKNKNIRNELYNIFDNLVTSNFDNVSNKIKNNKGVLLNMKESKNKKYFLGGCFGFACILMIFIGLIFFNNKSDVAIIGIDVNPSLELSINTLNKVVKVNTNNNDAIKIIDNMDLIGTNVDVAMNAIFGSMVKNGYINNDDNSVLISLVEGNYDVSKLANNVHNYLKNEKINSSILIENTNTSDYDNKLSSKYGISVSKVKLIRSIINKNSIYNFEELSKLNTNELNLLLNNNSNKNDNVSVIGNASTSKYISIDEVKNIVFKDSKIDFKNVNNLEIEFDYDDGVMVYDVEFYYDNNEYDYEIDAITGKILDKEVDYSKYENNNYLSKDKIKEIVLKKANVSKYYDYDIDFEFKGGVSVYEVEFETDEKEYEFELDAKTGKIINYEVKNKKIDNTKIINKNTVKNIVLNDSKVINYFDYEIELDNDDFEYEVSFETEDKEYEYKIDAITGKIIEREIDKRD